MAARPTCLALWCSWNQIAFPVLAAAVEGAGGKAITGAELPIVGTAARQSASLVGEVTRVAQPLTRTVADQVAALLSQVGRTKEAQEISDILLGSDEGRNSSEMQVAAGRSTKGRAGALTGPGVGAQLPVISESFNSTAALAIAAPQPGEQQENAVASSDGAGVDLDEIDPDTYGDKGVKYWQPPELAAPLAVENALAGMQRRQLSQLEAKIGDQRTELRQIDDGIKRKERDLAELQRKAAALQRDLQREREKRLRKKSLLDLREEQAEKLRERVVELEGLLHEGRMEVEMAAAREEGRRNAMGKLEQILGGVGLDAMKKEMEVEERTMKRGDSDENIPPYDVDAHTRGRGKEDL